MNTHMCFLPKVTINHFTKQKYNDYLKYKNINLKMSFIKTTMF